MPRLLLLRHAKSDWSVGSQLDHDRALAPRGRADAPRMGSYIAQQSLTPDQVLASTALRTRQTWEFVAPKLPRKPSVRFERRIYEASRRTLVTVINETAPEIETLMLVGHNPGMHELALWLVGRGDHEARERLGAKFPTAALAIIDLDSSWETLDQASGLLADFVVPKLPDT